MRKIDMRQLVRQQEKARPTSPNKRSRGKSTDLLRFAGELVGIASVLPPGQVHQSTVACRRRPQRQVCRGLLRISRVEPDDEIHWECPVCADSGEVIAWHGSRWDREPALRSGQIVSLLQVRAQRGHSSGRAGPVKAYELQVELIGGPVEVDQPVRRKLRIGGDRTLHELHGLIQRAFDRAEDEPYEFMFGAPYEADSQRFAGGLVMAAEGEDEEMWETKLITLEELQLKDGQSFGYLFDFGEEWIHRITVSRSSEEPAYLIHPRVVDRVGTSPPQYPDIDELWDDRELLDEMDDELPLSGLYGAYDPAEGPDPEAWLDLEELERLLLIVESHGEPMPALEGEREPSAAQSLLLHALIHFAAESALAENGGNDERWQAMSDRLSRHERIHQLGRLLLKQYLELPSAGPVERNLRPLPK